MISEKAVDDGELSLEIPAENSKEAKSKILPSLQLNDNKAGMDGLDTDRINEIIQEASRGSNYYNHQIRRQERINEKIKEMKEKLTSFSQAQINEANKKMDELLKKLEAQRDLSQIIVHVDMDAFYAAVEMRDDPSLRDKPMAVGSQSMMSTSNYVARRFGIRAAMPGFIGLKLCPSLVLVPPNFKKYTEVSKEIHSILKEYDPEVASVSLDEAYLNITTYISQINLNRPVDDLKNAQQIVQEMREKIHAKTQLTASAGIATSSMLAKICSDRNKPNGQFYLPPDKKAIDEFLFSLPVRKVCGIGNQTEQLLKVLDVVTCGDIKKHHGILSLLFSSIASTRFLEISLGLGSTCFKTDEPRKSISVERTFTNTSNVAELRQWCFNLSEELAKDLKRENLLGKTVTLKLKTNEFDVRTRAITLLEPTADVQTIYNIGVKILDKEINSYTKKPLTLRLMGVRMSSLVSEVDNTRITQRNIISFLQNTSKENELVQDQFFCPICNKFFCSLFAINSHLDVCLKTNELHENDSQQKITSSTLQPSFSSDEPVESAECNALTAKKQTIKSSESFFAVRGNKFLNKSNSSFNLLQYDAESGENSSLICPVCNKYLLSNIDQDINQHIDECLNKETVNSLLRTKVLPGKRTQSNSKQHIKRPKFAFGKNTTIETFFSKR